MLKAWTVDAGSMDVPNGFNGPKSKIFLRASVCCSTVSELTGWRQVTLECLLCGQALAISDRAFRRVPRPLEKSRRSKGLVAGYCVGSALEKYIKYQSVAIT